MSRIHQMEFGLGFFVLGEVFYILNPNLMAVVIAGVGLMGVILGMREGESKP